jgi:hypothetical protein
MAGDGRRGRRDNGLDAAAFVPLLDVDPRVGEHLLDVLGSAGVPAYLEPSADVEPYTRALSLPSPPTDRLWVDRDQRRQARIIVDAETPHGPRPVPPPRDDEPSHGLADADEERAWQDIIAGFDAPPATGRAPQRPGAPGWFDDPGTDPSTRDGRGSDDRDRDGNDRRDPLDRRDGPDSHDSGSRRDPDGGDSRGGPDRGDPRGTRDPLHPHDRGDAHGRGARDPGRRRDVDGGGSGDGLETGDPPNPRGPRGRSGPQAGDRRDRRDARDPDRSLDPRDSLDPGESLETRDRPDLPNRPDPQDPRDRSDPLDPLDPRNWRDAPDPRDPLDPRNRRDPLDPAEGRDVLDPHGWLGPDGLSGDRPRPDRDDLIVDPWSDLDTSRRSRRRSRGGSTDADPLPSGKDLDRAAEAKARAEAGRDDGDDIWIDGPPNLDGDEEHFEPPPPPPYPRLSRNTILAVLLVMLGILLMAVPQVIGLDDRNGLTLGVLSILAGGVLLVLRMRQARDEDGPDDGAVV